MIEVAGQVVGYAEWQDVRNGEAELGIAIGESRLWGQGLAAQAGRQMLAWAFGELGLRRVWAEVHAPNLRSLALMRKLGLRASGERGQGTYQGEPATMLSFELTPEEWRAASPFPLETAPS